MSGAAASARKLRKLACQIFWHASVHKLGRALSQHARRIRRQHGVQPARHLFDPGAIVLDHVRESLRDIDVAHEPHDAIDQQVFDRRIEIELQLAGHLVVERIDRAVERDHVVAVAHHEERSRDCRRRGAGLVADAHRKRRPAAVDHRVGELGRNDLAPQAVVFQSVRIALDQMAREIARELAPEIRVIRHARTRASRCTA